MIPNCDATYAYAHEDIVSSMVVCVLTPKSVLCTSSSVTGQEESSVMPHPPTGNMSLKEQFKCDVDGFLKTVLRILVVPPS